MIVPLKSIALCVPLPYPGGAPIVTWHYCGPKSNTREIRFMTHS